MPNSAKPSSKANLLLVEGDNDMHVIASLCGRVGFPKVFSFPEEFKSSNKIEGIDSLLAGLPLRLEESGRKILGVVVDADEDVASRWQALRDRLTKIGYAVPEILPLEGWIYTPPVETFPRPKIGIWIMPDNTLPGMLEDFVARLIPDDDVLFPKAEKILQELENEKINCYKDTHHAKALIHTWLAWQDTSGMPMGLAITAHALTPNSLLATRFINWLKLLFDVA
jgi:hypothetical protein